MPILRVSAKKVERNNDRGGNGTRFPHCCAQDECNKKRLGKRFSKTGAITIHNIDRGFLDEPQLKLATEDDLQKAVSNACDFIIKLKKPG